MERPRGMSPRGALSCTPSLLPGSPIAATKVFAHRHGMQAARTLSRQLRLAAPRRRFRAVPTSVGHQNRRDGANGPRAYPCGPNGRRYPPHGHPCRRDPDAHRGNRCYANRGRAHRATRRLAARRGPCRRTPSWSPPRQHRCRSAGWCERPCPNGSPGHCAARRGRASHRALAVRNPHRSSERALHQSVWDGLDAAPSRPHPQRRRQPLTWSHPVARPRRSHPNCPGLYGRARRAERSRANPRWGASSWTSTCRASSSSWSAKLARGRDR